MTALIPIERILPNPEQPRKVFVQDELTQLANSIKSVGVIQPIIVELAGDSYILHDGERRLRAARLAGLEQIPAVVVAPLNGTAAHDRLLRALVANVQRADLTPIEEARAYARLHKEHGLTYMQIASQVGTYYQRVLNRMELLKLDPDLQQLVAEDKLSSDHRVIRALMAIDDPKARLSLAKKAGSNNLSIKGLVSAAAKVSAAIQESAEPKSDRTPAISQGISRARRSLDLPAWNALSQAGTVPPWPVVEQAAAAVCDSCSLRSMAGSATCGACPAPLMIVRMIEKAADLKPAASPVPLRKK